MTATLGCCGRAPVVLDVVNVTHTYSGPPETTALRDVSLSIRAGEFAAIVGPSGSGKSTLLHTMGALDRPTEGAIYLDGTNTAELTDARLSALRGLSIGFVFQQSHLLEGLDAVDNVAAPLMYRGIRRSQRRNQARTTLERVDLGHRLDHRPAQLSGGERQRVAIARALAGEPAIIMADEPTGNLDTRTSNNLMRLLRGLNQSGVTILIITHDLGLAATCRRQLELRDGQLIADSAS